MIAPSAARRAWYRPGSGPSMAPQNSSMPPSGEATEACECTGTPGGESGSGPVVSLPVSSSKAWYRR